VIAVIGTLAVTAGVMFLVASNDSGNSAAPPSTSSTLSRRDKAVAESARAWQKQVIAAFTPMVNAAPELITGAREWLAGTRPAEQFQQELDYHISRFVAARDDVDKIAPYAKAPSAIQLFYVDA